ncbi:MAG: hypothetical protein HY898_13005 [Deltaproteobacteria bacterium]|nr:hypothetical protein [Deltaproteobacteria bacterium]
MLEPSDLRSRSPLRPACAAVIALALSGCGFPEHTYDLPEGDGGGNAGAAGDVSVEPIPDTSAGGTGGAQPDAPDSNDTPSEDALNEVQPDVVDAEVGTDVPDVLETGPETSETGDGPDDVVDSDAPDVTTDEAAVNECGSTVEDCTNGVDDDCDGKIDCQDTNCTALFKCTPPPPAGWQGYFQLYEGTAANLPSCGSPFSTLAVAAGRDPVFSPATCTNCSCGNPTGIQCGEPDIIIWQDATCSSPYGWEWGGSNPPLTPHNQCVPKTLTYGDAGGMGPPASVSLDPAQPVLGTGSCTASGGIATKPTPNWSFVAQACQADSVGVGCSAQQVCAPKPVAGYKTGLCIAKQGVQATCPIGGYNTRFVFYQDFADSRGCTQCTCDQPTGMTCPGTLIVSTSSTCAGASIEATLTGVDCKTIGPSTSKYLRYNDAPAAGGVCNSVGGQPSGTVTPDAATAYTFCCSPG